MEEIQNNRSEPRILAFLCNWCSYAGADLAGVSRIQYSPNIRIVRVMCSGRVDPLFIIEGFLNGSDGIMVLGCHPGDCHYLQGNHEAIHTNRAVNILLDYIGINSERLLLDWVSASEGIRFQKIVDTFTSRVRLLGNLGISEGKTKEQLNFELQAAKKVVTSKQFRWITGKQAEFMQSGNRYGEQFTLHEIKRALESTIIKGLIESKIITLLENNPLSVEDISKSISLPVRKTYEYVKYLVKKGTINIKIKEGGSPLYFINAGRRLEIEG